MTTSSSCSIKLGGLHSKQIKLFPDIVWNSKEFNGRIYVRIPTMIYVVLPQTFKNTLPALANEFIVLIKETSISGYIGLKDLTMGGNIIRSNTYQAFFPLITVAIIYLVIVMVLTAGVNKLERRLKKNER